MNQKTLIRSLFLAALSAISLGPLAAANPEGQGDFYRFSVVDIEGKTHSLSEYQGKVVLVVNTASRCGFTPQYKGLEALYRQYKDRGLVILGFPSNDFLGQEPGSNEDIKTFCELNYQVSFPMFSKIGVTGPKAHPLFVWLADRKTNPNHAASPGWNFTKYLVSRDGRLIGRFDSPVDPQATQVITAVEAALGQ